MSRCFPEITETLSLIVGKDLVVYELRRGGDVRLNVPQGATSHVPPVSMIQNVPQTRAGVGAEDVRSMGSVAIHINGNSHDPESLATLVQRRIDESMNWRTHHTASKYAWDSAR